MRPILAECPTATTVPEPRVFVGNTVLAGDEARVLVCESDSSRITGVLISGQLRSHEGLVLPTMSAVSVPLSAITACEKICSFDFSRSMAHDAVQDIVLRCHRSSAATISLGPLVTRKRGMPGSAALLRAGDRIAQCWSQLYGLAQPLGLVPPFSND